MPDEERTVEQLAAALRQALDDDERPPYAGHREDDARRRTDQSALVATGAALGDRQSLPSPDVEVGKGSDQP